MAFSIDGFDMIEFDIPAGKGKKITLSVPPYDCVAPADTAAMNEQLRALEGKELDFANDPNQNAAALVRLMLKHFNPGKQKGDAIDALVPRQLAQIDELWTKESGMTVGESSTSTDESSETEE